MRSYLLSLAIALFGWLSMESHAAACTCPRPDPARSYANADHVIHARIQLALPRTGSSPNAELRYLARLVEDDYKGCLKTGSSVMVVTAGNSAACGIQLRAGQEVVLYGQAIKTPYGGTQLRVALCDPNGPWSAITPEHKQFLSTRYVKCRNACADGSRPVQCFVDPCSVSSCDVEGATCEANYCGGCNAEWSDASGTRVCDASEVACDYDAPGRRFVARSPEECQRVRFACGEGEEPFFDDCGCGCNKSKPEPVTCHVGGCSGQLCVGPGEPDISTCLFREEYACYRSARCELQAGGRCGWTDTPELRACLDAAR